MADSMHTLSIIVVTFNEARHTARLQRSIDALRVPQGVTVESVLVDGGSTDGTPEAAREAGFSRVVVHPGASIPVCRNIGAREASGDWLAYVDGDCEVAPDWLEQAMVFMRELDRVILGWPARPPEPMNALQQAWNFHWLNKNPRMEEFLGRRVVREQGFRLATTRNMMMHRAVFDALKGFNEELPTGEDTDFAFRAYMADIPVLGVPESKVIHHGEPVTVADFYKQQKWHANRRSYEHIMKLSKGRVGGNAPKYTAAYLAAASLFFLGILLAAGFQQPLALWLCLAWPGVIGAPAAWISLKGRTFRHLPMLFVLYAVYGWARALDLLGFARLKPSWKISG